eukprot:1997963-Amphidinium_carterae.1
MSRTKEVYEATRFQCNSNKVREHTNQSHHQGGCLALCRMAVAIMAQVRENFYEATRFEC